MDAAAALLSEQETALALEEKRLELDERRLQLEQRRASIAAAAATANEAATVVAGPVVAPIVNTVLDPNAPKVLNPELT